MKQHLDHAAATFTPQQHKSFASALEAFFALECPQLGGVRTRQVLVQAIAQMVTAFFPETSHLRPGQTPWVTVDKDEVVTYGKTIRQSRLTTVNLDLVPPSDAIDRAAGKPLRELKRDAIARLFTQAYEQGGCLTSAEVALLLKICPGTVGKYTAAWEAEHHRLLPRRGTIHDLGPTLTHKRIIIHQLFIEQHSVERVSRDTYHSPLAIQRYIGTFRQILACRLKGLTPDETAFTVGISRRLVDEYQTILDDYQQQGHLLDQLQHVNPNFNEPPTHP